MFCYHQSSHSLLKKVLLNYRQRHLALGVVGLIPFIQRTEYSGKTRENWVNIIAADTTTPCVVKTPRPWYCLWRIYIFHHGRPCGTEFTRVGLYSRNHAHYWFYFFHNVWFPWFLHKNIGNHSHPVGNHGQGQEITAEYGRKMCHLSRI